MRAKKRDLRTESTAGGTRLRCRGTQRCIIASLLMTITVAAITLLSPYSPLTERVRSSMECLQCNCRQEYQQQGIESDEGLAPVGNKKVLWWTVDANLEWNEIEPLPDHMKRIANCAKLYPQKSLSETVRTAEILFEEEERSKLEYLYRLNMTNCTQFVQLRRYQYYNITQQEADFPIAYVVKVYHQFEQFERLMRIIHRPSNIYCIHVDLKSAPEFKDRVQHWANCFDNVFIASVHWPMYWSYWTTLMGDMQCFKDLIQIGEGKTPIKTVLGKKITNVQLQRWRYAITVTAEEFPIRTNAEIVTALTLINGANVMEGYLMPKHNMARIKNKWIFKVDDGKYYYMAANNTPIPGNLTILKGDVAGIFSRAYVKYLVSDKFAVNFFDWCKGTGFPDEHVYGTLNWNKKANAPGGYRGDKPYVNVTEYDAPMRLKMWGEKPNNCRGPWVRAICIITKYNLKDVVHSDNIYLNKILLDSNRAAYRCLEEEHEFRTNNPQVWPRPQKAFIRRLRNLPNVV